MSDFYELFPSSEELLKLEPEELAGFILQYLNSLGSKSSGEFNRANFTSRSSVARYPGKNQDEVGKALMEAWIWLEREGLLAPKPGDTHGWYFVTRRGQTIKNHIDLDKLQKANMLPKKQLHPAISTRVWGDFLRGDYDGCVFKAFKEVEVAVRNAGGLQKGDIGTDLMRKAFKVPGGPLTESGHEKGEQEAVGHLFAGSIGFCKNPSSHHNVELEAEETVELLIFASYLLRIVDKRSKT